MSNIFKKNKLISLLLTFGMLFSSAIPVYATDINKSDGNGKSKVVTTVTPAKFNVTVPYVLPISIDSDQNVYTADNVAISNNSNGPIKVSEATLTTNEGWELVADETDFSSVPVNSKQFSMRVLNSPVLTSGNLNTESFGTINGNSALCVTYYADAAVQGEEVSATNIANVLFTIEWDNVEITSATVSKTALQSFAKTVTTFQKTSERLNIDDVKATDGVTKIDDGVTDKSIYAWADSNGNGYWWTDAMIAYLPIDCSGLFYNYENLTSLDLSGFDTSNVTNMNGMFENCYDIVSLDLSSFDTFKVTDMGLMFKNCYLLKTLDISSFDTSNVVDMSYMFYNLDALASLNLTNLNTSNVLNMQYMFYSNTFTTLDISSFDTSNVKDMTYMFGGCYSLSSLDLSNFDTSNVTTMKGMFGECWALSSLDISSFDTSNVKDMTYMFGHCENLVTLDLSTFNTSNVTMMTKMFRCCYSLSSLNLSSFNTSSVTDMSNMFDNCYSLSSLDLSNFDTSSVTNISEMFYYCSKLVKLDLSSFNTSNVTRMVGVFRMCSNLLSINLTSFNTNKVTSMDDMFYGCSKLEVLDLSSFNTAKVGYMREVFYKCSSLTTIEVSTFSIQKVTGTNLANNMFYGCTKLVGQNGTVYNSSITNYKYARIDTADTPGYFTYKAKVA